MDKKPVDWKNITLNVRKFSLVLIGLDEWSDPITVYVFAELGSRARIHYPTYFKNMDTFLAVKDELGLEIAIDDEKDREAFIKQFKEMEKVYAKYRKSINWLKTAFERVAFQEAEKEPTDKTG